MTIEKNNINPPCKLSFKHYDTEITITKDYSAVNIEDFRKMCISVALASGFPAESVKEYFDNE